MRRNGILLVFMLIATLATAQASIFGARAVVGFNASQISGDALAGFDRVGLVAGLKGTAELAEKLHLNIDFLYSQRGSKPNIFDTGVDPDIEIKLQYLDMPVYLTYSDWKDEEGGFYKAYFSGGFSYGRLMGSDVIDNYNDAENNLENQEDSFNKNDVSWLLGFGFRLSRRFGIDLRYTRSITLLLEEDASLGVPPLRPYFISIRGEYIF